MAAEFIREIYHSEWLANLVMVPKKDESLRIDHIVDSTAGCERLSFLDAYSGYPQIRLYGPDEIKNSFHHPIWVLLLCHYAIRFEER